MDTIIERIARGAEDAPAILAPERRGADPWRAAAPDGGDRGAAQRARNRPRRPGGDRARQRPGDGDRLRLGRRCRHHRAAQPRLSRGGIRLLPLRHRRQGADRRRRRGRAGGRRRRTAWHRRPPPHARRRRTGGAVHAGGSGDRRGRAAGPGGGGRRRASPPHLRHDLAAEAGAAHPCQPRRLRRPYRRDAAAHARRPLPQHHAAVPHPRADRGGARLARGRRQHVLHARLQRAPLLRASRRGEAELVHGGADHAPGDPRPRRAKSRGGRRGEAPLHPLVLGVAAAAGDGRARGAVLLPGDRVLRDDRSRAPDDLQPAAAGGAEAGQRRHRRGTRGRDHGRGRRAARRRIRSARS